MSKPKWRCWKCKRPQELIRVDLHGPPPKGCFDEHCRSRGLGIVHCPNPECEEHDFLPSDATASPGRAFWQACKDNTRCGGRRWTQRCEAHAHTALILAIRANMAFYPWDAEFVPFGEAYYTYACQPYRGDTANLDAARAMESCWGRPPFILEGKRLATSVKFWWGAASAVVEVSSIRHSGDGDDRRDYLVAICHDEHGKRRQFKITPTELRAAEREGEATRETRRPCQHIAEKMARRKEKTDATHED